MIIAHSCTKVTGGTSSPGSCCTFPFIFKGHTYNNCLPFGDGKGRTWCSLTSDFDKERRWGMCSRKHFSLKFKSIGNRAFALVFE